MRRLIPALAVVAICGWASTALAATRSITASESGGLSYSAAKLRAKPGKVTIRMVNPSSLGLKHSVAIRGNGVSKQGAIVRPGGTSTVSARLKKGTYTFYCYVDGHEGDGMKGTLRIR